MTLGLIVDKNNAMDEIIAPDMLTALNPNLFMSQLTIGPDKLVTPIIKDPIHEIVDLLESKSSINGPRRTPNEFSIPPEK